MGLEQRRPARQAPQSLARRSCVLAAVLSLGLLVAVAHPESSLLLWETALPSGWTKHKTRMGQHPAAAAAQRPSSGSTPQQQHKNSSSPSGVFSSRGTIVGAVSAEGPFTRHRYRFENVLLSSDDELAVLLPPSAHLPATALSVDTLHGIKTIQGNASAAEMPTTVFYPGVKDWGQLRISYRHAGKGEKLECQRWEERPVYLLQVGHMSNIWHSWNDGLMGAYQTLREEGFLPLAEIDADGNMKEYTADLDLDEGCPWVIQQGSGVMQRPSICRPLSGVVTKKRCDPARDSWCVPGLAVVNRSAGPILLRAKGTAEVLLRWRSMYAAVSQDVRSWESMVGVCFRTLLVGKSNTLNFYVALNASSPFSRERAKAESLRQRAMEAFRRVMLTAQHEKQAQYPQRWDGYSDPGLEKLRRGVGPSEIEALAALRQARNRAVVASTDFGVEDRAELREALRRSRAAMRRTVAAAALGDVGNGSLLHGAQSVKKRLVVTFIWRKQLSRCVLNEADLLEYILRRYNATIRITTFEEPLLEAMQQMAETDVLVAMHGAGLTNAMFLSNMSKPRGAALQMMPYGWLNSVTNRTIRGGAYKNIIVSNGWKYAEWVNQKAGNAFMRRQDFKHHRRKEGLVPDFSLHPLPEWPKPTNQHGAAYYIYQNTVVDVGDWARVFDALIAGMAP